MFHEETRRDEAGQDFVELMERKLLEEYAPAAVLIDEAHRALSHRGPIADYLDVDAGDEHEDIVTTAKPGLQASLRDALQRATRGNERVSDAECWVQREGAYVQCVLSVSPVTAENGSALFLVTFRDGGERDVETPLEAGRSRESSVVKRLECELEATRRDLQGTIEALESANEELRVSNEEIASMNEELTFTNDALEVSKEDLESLNAELGVVNTSLQREIEQVKGLNDDLSNLMNSTQIPAIFLDRADRVKRFTPSAMKLLHLGAADVGRPVGELSLGAAGEGLLDDVRRVTADFTHVKKGVSFEDGRYYLRRVLPYQTTDRRIEGVVVTWTDITDQKRAEEALSRLNEALEQRVSRRTAELEQANVALAANERRFRLLADNVPAFFSYADAAERYRFVNRAFAELYEARAEELVGRTVRDVIGERAYELAKPHVDAVLSGHEEKFERPLFLRDAGDRWLSVQYVPDFDEKRSVSGFYTLIVDITERIRSERALRENKERLEAIVNTAVDAIITIDAQGVVDAFNPAAERMFGYPAEEVVGRNVRMLMPEPYHSEHDGYIRRYVETGEARMIGAGREVRGRRKDGSTFPLDLAVSEMGARWGFTALLRDITERKRTQEALENSHGALRSLSARLLAAEESQRRAVAQELHDDFSQRLAMVCVDVGSLKDDHPELSEELEEIGESVAGLADDMHRLAYSLHPSILDHLGLSAALQKLLDEFSARYGIQVTFRERGPTDGLASRTSTCLYRTAQEALTNVAKHSKSPRATVRLLATPSAVRLSVRDYGEGFDVNDLQRRSESLGLTGMQERVRLAAGTFTIRSAPGEGTTLRTTCPRELGGL